MTELAALNVKINGDSADLQSDIARAKKQLAAFEAQANKANKGTKGFSGSLAKLGNISGSTRAKIQNTSFQLQDIAVQLSMGTRASTVFAQQLPQLASGFGAVGAVIGVLAGVGIPALAFAFSAAGDSAKTFGGSLSGLEEEIENINKALDELRGKQIFAEQNLQLEEQIPLFREIERIRAQIAERERLMAIPGKEGGYGFMQREAAEEENKTARKRIAAIQAQIRAINAEVVLREEQIAKAQESLRIQRQTADEFASAAAAGQGVLAVETKMLRERKASAEEAARTAEIQNRFLIEGAAIASRFAGEAEVMSQSLDGTKAAAAGVKYQTQLAKEQASGLNVAAGFVFDKLNGISGAIESALPFADHLKTKLFAAGEAFFTALKVTSEGPGVDPLTAFGGFGAFKYGDPSTFSPDMAGGGADPLIGQLESVQNALMTQEEQQIASFQRQQETLQQALEQRLLTQQQYNELFQEAEFQHANAMAQIKQKETQMVTSAQTAMYSELGNLLGMFATKSKAAAIAQIAINKALSIASIIQNTAMAQVRALAELGPILGPPAAAKIAAFGKIQAGLVAATGFAQAAGAGGSGGGGGGSFGAAAAASAPAPLDVRLSGVSADEFISGASIQSLFDRLQDEAGDRGLRVSFA